MDTLSIPTDQLIDRGWRPIWQEHVADIDGKSVPMDRAALERVAANSNDLITRTGAYGVIIEGHTDPDRPREVRPVRGYLGPYKVGEFAGKPTIFGRERYFRDFAPRLKDFPFKSAEYAYSERDPANGRIAAAALLHAGETPRFHLGLNYADGDARRLRYSAAPLRDDQGTAMADDKPSADKPPEAAAPQAPAQAPTPAAPAVDPAMLEAMQAAILPAVKQVVLETLQAAGVMPAPQPASTDPPGNNPPMPPAFGDEKKADYSDVEHRLRYEREIAARRAAEERAADAEKRLAAVDDERRKTARYAAIAQLRADGYVTESDEQEFAGFAAFDDAQFPIALEQRRRYGARVPRGSLPIPPSDPLALPVDNAKRGEKAAQAAALSRKKGIGFDQAMAEIG
jgi:hypothetical protein